MTMQDKHDVQLLLLLAQYAEAYGKDCDAAISVKEVADDIVDSVSDADLPLWRTADAARDRVYDGLNQTR